MGIFRMIYFQICSFALLFPKLNILLKEYELFFIILTNFPFLLQISSAYVALGRLKRKCGTAGSAAQQVGQRLPVRRWCPSGPQSIQIVCRFFDQLWRYNSDNQVLSFCSFDSVCIISKFTSQDLLDSAHLNNNSFHMLYNLDIISSMKTVKLHK